MCTPLGERFACVTYDYLINRRGRDGCIFLRCAKSRQCKGAVNTKENEIISGRSDEHNHPQNEAEIVVSTVSHCFGHVLHE